MFVIAESLDNATAAMLLPKTAHVTCTNNPPRDPPTLNCLRFTEGPGKFTAIVLLDVGTPLFITKGIIYIMI